MGNQPIHLATKIILSTWQRPSRPRQERPGSAPQGHNLIGHTFITVEATLSYQKTSEKLQQTTRRPVANHSKPPSQLVSTPQLDTGSIVFIMILKPCYVCQFVLVTRFIVRKCNGQMIVPLRNLTWFAKKSPWNLSCSSSLVINHVPKCWIQNWCCPCYSIAWMQ